MDVQWYEDNPAACLDNGSKRPTRIWGREGGSLVLVESDCQSLYCPECPRGPHRSEGCAQRAPKNLKAESGRARVNPAIASKNYFSEDDLAARVAEIWLELGKPPRVVDLNQREEGKPSGTIIRNRMGGIGCAINAGRAWLEREGKWDDGLEEGVD